MCGVTWCNKSTEFYNKSQRYKYCSTHIQYKNWVSNANTRPWLMYKLEKILDNKIYCEKCGFDPIKLYPDRPKKQLVSLLDVDHIDPSIKGLLKGEQPSNYQLVCKHCHILKSHDEGDFIAKKYKK
tara:strand:+ start:455 stop:832 length:378 start_codon:yes stop_codon:yes gene_type:complete